MILYVLSGVGCVGTIIGLISMVLYKRQVVSICRQIHFLNEEDSNLFFYRDIGTKEFNTLIEELNQMMSKWREDRSVIERKDRELKETITNISHDIRTPLTSLNGYFELLQETDNQEDRDRYCAIIKDRIHILKDMLEQLFTYVKLQNGDYTFETETIDVNSEITDVLISFYEEFKRYGIEPVIHLTEEQIVKELNKMAFRRIFENIIKNSLEHGKSHFEFKMETDEKAVVFTIKNDMKQMEDIEVDKVFRRFYKADESRSQTSSGLGLAVAHDMVEKMNGTIRAEIVDNLFTITVIFDSCNESLCRYKNIETRGKNMKGLDTK